MCISKTACRKELPMETQTYTLSFNRPSVDEFALHYPQYGNLVRNEGLAFFDLIMTPESFLSAQAVTVDLGRPAIAGIARKVTPILKQHIDRKNLFKQYIGAVVCVLMEANGFEKTNEKKSVQYPGFNRGEVYKLR